jgi:hypothetical protein
MDAGRNTGSDGSGRIALASWYPIRYARTFAVETAEVLKTSESPHVVSYDLNKAARL